MPFKIRHKLFLAILLANTLLAIGIFLLGNWVFSHSFRDYLDQTEADRLSPLVQELADIYSQERNWRWVRNRQDPTWRQLMQRYNIDGGPRKRFRRWNSDFGDERLPPPEALHHQAPIDGRPFAIRAHLLLQNADKNLVFGRPGELDLAYWLPIKLEASVVGYLGFIRRVQITGDLDLLFASRLKSNYAWMVLGILLISALISIPLARVMVKPVERLRQSMHELAAGNYRVSLEQDSNDEIGGLAQDFNTLAATLDKNLSARQQWIADISHELRTPVAVLQGEIEAIQDGIRQPGKESINSLHQEVVRLSKLVNDLHELSLSDVGALSYRREACNIVELIDKVVEQFRPSLEDKSIVIKLNASADNIVVYGDYARLEQLFANLATNSRHYTQSPGTISVTISAQKDQVIITWSDSAPGVTDSDLGKLFDRLYRVEASRNRNAGGSGLGLAICDNIVQASQGEISAEHSPLDGISIVIRLPLIKEANK